MAVVAAIALLVSASPSVLADEVPHDQEIAMRGIDYEHDVVAVTLGETVTWTNQDAVDHTVTSDDCDTGDCTFASGTVQAGETFEWTPTEAGTVFYHCEFHPSMQGELRVQTEDAGDPDLEIFPSDISVENPPLIDGVPFLPHPYHYEIDATLSNTGGAGASNVDVVVEYETPSGDTGTIAERTVTVPANGEHSISTTWDGSDHALDSGTYKVKVTLDPANDVIEGFEDDNFAEKQFSVGPAGLTR